MGVTSNGKKGNSFDSPQMGIRAQVQHLKAYACTEKLMNPKVDPRFRYVARGSAPYVEWLGILENPQGKGWAAGAGYVQFMESLPAAFSYMVKVGIPDLNIRKGSGVDYARTGRFTGAGVFTIVEEADGTGDSKWGMLESYQKKRDGRVGKTGTSMVAKVYPYFK